MYAKNENGTIRIYSHVPKIFENDIAFSQRAIGYLNSKGFYTVVMPVPDPAIEKLGAIEWDATNEVFTYPKIALTQTEIDQRAEQELNSDVFQTAIDQRRSDGQLGYDRIMAIIERKFRSGEITAPQAKSALQFFDPLIEALNRGQWILVQIKLNAATVPSGYQSLFTRIQTKIDSYIQNEY